MDEQKIVENRLNVPLKRKRIKWGRIAIVVAVLVILALFIPIGSQSIGKMFLNSITGNAVGSSIAAYVDDKKITAKELEDEYNRLNSQLKSVYTKDTLLRELILEKLILSDALEKKFKVSDDEFNKILNDALLNLPNGITLEQIAKEQGYTVDEFKTRIRNQLLIKKYMDENIIVKDVGEREAILFFNQNKERLKSPEQVNASHILVKTLEETDDIEKQLKSGKKFEDLAKEKSLDPGSKNLGGNLGYFPRGIMVTEFENMAFNMSIGQISDPVKTQFGYHIIRLEGKKSSSEANFDELKDQIIKYLQDQENQKEISEFRTNLLENALSSGNVKILYKGDKELNS